MSSAGYTRGRVPCVSITELFFFCLRRKISIKILNWSILRHRIEICMYTKIFITIFVTVYFGTHATGFSFYDEIYFSSKVCKKNRVAKV